MAMQHHIIAAAAVAVLLAALVSSETMPPQTPVPATPAPTTPAPSDSTTTLAPKTTTTTVPPTTTTTTVAPATTTTVAPLTAPVKTPAPTTAVPSIPTVPTPVPAPTSDKRCSSFVNTSAHFFDNDLPLACPGPQSCVKAVCLCNGGAFNATTFECVTGDVKASVFEGCAAGFIKCLVESANTVAATPSGMSKCDSYAVALTRDYITFYAATDKKSTSLYQGCDAVLCNGGFGLTGTAVNTTTACLLANAAAPFNNLPPATPAPTRMMCPATSYLNFYNTYVPYMKCGKSLLGCYSSFCSCIGGTFSSSAGTCSEGLSMVSEPAAEICMATSMNCILNTALAMYVPMSSTSSSDVCTRWPAQVAKSYAAYYNQSVADRANNEIVSGCNAVACNSLTTFYYGQVNYSAACNFPATAPPLYVDPIQYTCPDGSKVTAASDCACIQSATITASPLFSPSLSSNLSPDSAINGALFATYRGTGACASSAAFESFLSFQWIVTNSVAVTVVSSTSRTLNIPRGSLAAGTYRVTFRVFGLVSAAVFEDSRLFTVVNPAPIVNLKLGSTVRASTQNNITLTATVTTFGTPSSELYGWACVSLTNGVACPTFINASALATTIASGSAAGTFSITFTYTSSLTAGVSQTMTLTTVAAQVPVAQIVTTSSPAAAPNKYLSSQTLIMSAVYSSFSGSVLFNWTINGTVVDSSRSTAVLLSAFTSGTYVVTLKVISASDPTVYGETATLFVVMPRFSMTLAVTCASCIAGVTPVGLTDTLNVAVSGLDPSITDYNYQLFFSYYTSKSVVLAVNRVGAGFSYTATAPLTTGAQNSSGVSVIFFATLQINGISAATSNNATLSIATPNLNDAVNNQIANIQNIRDTSSALDAAATLQTMMESSQLDDTKKKQLAATALNVLVNSVGSNADKLTPVQQTQMLSTFSTSLGTQKSDETQRKVMSEAVAGVLTSMISSASFSFDSAGPALAALDSCDPTVASNVMNTFALIMTKNPNLTPGTPLTLTAGNLSLTTLKDTAAGLTSVPIKSGGATVTMNADTFAGRFGADEMIALASTSSTSNTLAKDGNADPTDGVATFDVTKDGVRQEVKNLDPSKAIAIGLTTTGSAVKQCKFFNTTSNAWSTDGVVTVIDANGKVTCMTTHFTAFGSFAVTSTTPTSNIALAHCDGGCVAGVVLGSVGAVVMLVAVIFGIKKAMASPAGTGQPANEPTSEMKPDDTTATAV